MMGIGKKMIMLLSFFLLRAGRYIVLERNGKLNTRLA
jgi:hypothetical protein